MDADDPLHMDATPVRAQGALLTPAALPSSDRDPLGSLSIHRVYSVKLKMHWVGRVELTAPNKAVLLEY
jgi:hypothetical protein